MNRGPVWALGLFAALLLACSSKTPAATAQRLELPPGWQVLERTGSDLLLGKDGRSLLTIDRLEGDALTEPEVAQLLRDAGASLIHKQHYGLFHEYSYVFADQSPGYLGFQTTPAGLFGCATTHDAAGEAVEHAHLICRSLSGEGSRDE